MKFSTFQHSKHILLIIKYIYFILYYFIHLFYYINHIIVILFIIWRVNCFCLYFEIDGDFCDGKGLDFIMFGYFLLFYYLNLLHWEIWKINYIFVISLTISCKFRVKICFASFFN